MTFGLLNYPCVHNVYSSTDVSFFPKHSSFAERKKPNKLQTALDVQSGVLGNLCVLQAVPSFIPVIREPVHITMCELSLPQPQLHLA